MSIGPWQKMHKSDVKKRRDSAEPSLIAITETPLQLRNAVSYAHTKHVSAGAINFVLVLSGNFTWDSQTLDTAHALGVSRAIVVGAPPQNHIVTEGLRRLEAMSERYVRLRLFLGSRALSRTWALLVAARVIAQRCGRWDATRELILGNPMSAIPLYPLILGPRRRIVIVDDGLSMLNFMQLRACRRRQGTKWRHLLALTNPPGLSERRITVFTIFDDLTVSDGVTLQPNTGFTGWRNRIQVREGVAWILGNPLVEEGGLDLKIYRGVISMLHRAMMRVGLDTYYLPHRRECREVTTEVLRGLGPKLVTASLPVEERVMKERAVASVVVAFGSTALETLSQMTPLTCRLWSLLLVPPNSKRGSDSPEEIFSRHKADKRIRVIVPEELDHVIFG